MRDLNIVILNYNTKKLTLDCIKSILSSKPKKSIKISVVDNASIDKSVDAIKKKYPAVSVYKSKKNIGFSRGNNLGLKKVYKDSRYCLVLNSDTLINKGTIDRLINFADRNEYAILSCKLKNKDGSFQPNTGNIPTFLPLVVWLSNLDGILGRLPSFHRNNDSYYKKDREVGWVSGSAMLINSNFFKKHGFFDEKIFMYGEDVDICWRAKKANEKAGWTKSTQITHFGGASIDNQPKYSQYFGEFRGLLYLYKKYYGSFASFLIKILIYIFSLLRVVAFYLVGRREHAKIYAKIVKNL